MSDLIKREDVVKEFGRVFGDLGLTLFGVGGNDLAQVIANAIPSAERKGEWIEHKARTIVMDNNFVDFFPTEYECSNCGLRRATYFINSQLSNYCPNCGARMKGAEDE